MTRLDPYSKDALIIVDVQNDFMPGGSLPVPEGDEITDAINRLALHFANVVITQDWHPRGHASFASSHPGAAAFARIAMPYGEQTLWPDHCVQGTPGAALHAKLNVDRAFLLIRKGVSPGVDSYSAFAEADGRDTGLAALLHARGVKRVFVCGLATNVCVALSAQDAAKARFESAVIEDASRGIDVQGSLEAAWARMAAAGVQRVTIDHVLS